MRLNNKKTHFDLLRLVQSIVTCNQWSYVSQHTEHSKYCYHYHYKPAEANPDGPLQYVSDCSP